MRFCSIFPLCRRSNTMNHLLQGLLDPQRCRKSMMIRMARGKERGSCQRLTYLRAALPMMPRTNRYASSSKLGSVRSKVRLGRGVPKDIASATSRVATGPGRIFSAIMQTEKLAGVAMFHRIRVRVHLRITLMLLR